MPRTADNIDMTAASASSEQGTRILRARDTMMDAMIIDTETKDMEISEQRG